MDASGIEESSECDEEELYPILSVLRRNSTTNCDKMMKGIAKLLPTICVLEYMEEMNLDLQHITESLRGDLKSSLQSALYYHKEQIRLEYLTFLFVHIHTDLQLINWGVCELLEPAETQLHPVHLLKALLYFDELTRNSQYITSFTQTLLCLMDRCVRSLFHSYLVFLVLQSVCYLSHSLSTPAPCIQYHAE